MKHKKLFALPMLAIGVLVLCATAYAQDSDEDKLGPYKLLTTINNIPGGLTRFDISWVDSETGRYYLASRGNVAATPPVGPNITVIDTERNKFLYLIPLPKGVTGNGVVAIHRTGDDNEEEGPGTLVVGGSDSTAIFIDLAHPFASPFTVSTGGNNRADELAYDPADHIILIANDRDTPSPFITFISTEPSPHVIPGGKILYPGAGGIEQPVWDGFTKRFYLAVPSTPANPNGEVDELNPKTLKVTRVFPTTCGPTGLVLIPGQRLMTACGDVLDIAKGKVVHTVPGVGADEIWFNSGDERVYFGTTTVPVVNGLPPYNVIGNLPTGPLAANQTTHSIAADKENNRIFVPFTNLGVLVFGYARDDSEGPDN
jgi:hypothetical protein